MTKVCSAPQTNLTIVVLPVYGSFKKFYSVNFVSLLGAGMGRPPVCWNATIRYSVVQVCAIFLRPILTVGY